VNNNPIGETDTVIIVPTYDGHLMFLKNVLQQYKKTGKYVICSYDRHTEVPPKDILDVPDAWVWKHKTYGANKRNGWLWDIVYAAGIVGLFENVKYIIISNGDCVWDKPEGIFDLIGLLGKYDVMSASFDRKIFYGYELKNRLYSILMLNPELMKKRIINGCEIQRYDNSCIHTCNMVWKRDCFLAFVDEVKENLNNNIPESHSPEVLLREFMKKYDNFINIPVKKQPVFPKEHYYGGIIDHYSSYNQDSTFKDVVGYRNLGGEHKAACLEHLEPLPSKYFDLRDNGKFLNVHERDTLLNYYLNNDRRWLYKYWAEGEDSHWNRRYYPIDYYGDEPLYNDSKRKELGPPSERLGHFNRWKYNSFVLKDDEYKEKWKEVIGNGG